jgi:hypothetical protein
MFPKLLTDVPERLDLPISYKLILRDQKDITQFRKQTDLSDWALNLVSGSQPYLDPFSCRTHNLEAPHPHPVAIYNRTSSNDLGSPIPKPPI